MSVLRVLNILNANSNVGGVLIGLLSNRIEWNNEILKMMIDRFTNVYDIAVFDYNNNIDDGVHNIIK